MYLSTGVMTTGWVAIDDFELSQSAIAVRKYYYAGGTRIALREGAGTGTSGLSWILTDHLGSTTVTAAGSSGAKTAELSYLPWGKTNVTSGATPTDYRFTGQRQETELGLYFYNARWYDPALGRFVQADTIVPEVGNPLAWDWYAYTNNNPVRYNDPSGHCIGPFLAVCITIGTFIADNAAIITAITSVGAITTFITADSPKQEMIDNPEAVQKDFEDALIVGGLWLSGGSAALEFGSYFSIPRPPHSVKETADDFLTQGNPRGQTTQNLSSPDFIVSSDGNAIIVPRGATGPLPTNNGKGFQLSGGSGGNGLSNQANGVRIMDPTEPKPPSPGYPNGYVTYYNKYGQTINPFNGKTINKTDAWWHISLGKE